jgi:hypothetical protein
MIEQPTVHRRTGVATAVGILSAVYVVTFFLGRCCTWVGVFR